MSHGDEGRAELRIIQANASALIAVARALMAEYAAMPHTVGRWTTAAEDLAALPVPYVPPHGALLLAFDGELAVGCGVLHPLEPGSVAEIKRVYVRPEVRGRGVGAAITRALMESAAAGGYRVIRLDTAPELLAAQALYRRMGFVAIPRYRDDLYADALCFEYRLDGV